jgi:hypothetical protein
MSTAAVEEFATVEEMIAWALEHPLKFIELGVSLGGATREKALALLKQGINRFEAKFGKPLHEHALESLDGRCKPDGNHFRALPYGFEELREGVWLPFTREYKPLGLWPLGCSYVYGCKRPGCAMNGRSSGRKTNPLIAQETQKWAKVDKFSGQFSSCCSTFNPNTFTSQTTTFPLLSLLSYENDQRLLLREPRARPPYGVSYP